MSKLYEVPAEFAARTRIRRAVIGSGAGPNASDARNDSEGPGDRGETVDAPVVDVGFRIVERASTAG